MIGTKVAQMILDSKQLNFYKAISQALEMGANHHSPARCPALRALDAQVSLMLKHACETGQAVSLLCIISDIHLCCNALCSPTVCDSVPCVQHGSRCRKTSAASCDCQLLTFKWLLQYDGDYKPMLDGVRQALNDVAEGWTREQKDHCLDETMMSFRYSNGLLQCIAQPQ